MISFVYIEPFVPIMSNPDITAKTSVVCNFYTYILHSYGLYARMPKYFAEEQLSRIRRPERRHNCNPDLWWWVAGGGPFSEKQSTIILHKNLFTWQPWLREYAGKFGWRGPDLIDWIFVAKWTKDHLKLPPKKSSSVFNLCRRIFQPKLISSERKALRRKSTMVILVFVIEVHVFVFVQSALYLSSHGSGCTCTRIILLLFL